MNVWLQIGRESFLTGLKTKTGIHPRYRIQNQIGQVSSLNPFERIMKMNRAEVKKCIYLLASLWTNYKPPQDEMMLQVQTEAWLTLFGNVPATEVQNTIMSIAAEGCEFAPQIGQIYARLKNQREERKALQATTVQCDDEYAESFVVHKTKAKQTY